MRIAIPICAERISPVFDVSGRLLLTDIEGGTEVSRDEKVLDETHPPGRVEQIVDLGVDVLICGAISRPLEGMLGSAGVRVIPYVCGRAEEVLQAFLSGQLDQQRFLMPGYRGHWGRFRARHGRKAHRFGI